MRILVIGESGQLGQELSNLLYQKGINFLGTTSESMDITVFKEVNKTILDYKPDVIFDCAAYTSVDKAEEEPGKTTNWNVNVNGTRYVAKIAESIGATLVYISTDYVFDGKSKDMYEEDSKTNPLNEYGKAKCEAEMIVSKIMSRYYIVRTSWVFGKYGNNFVNTMLSLSQTHNNLNVVADQFGRPTWTFTLAEFMLYLVDNNIDYGLYNLSNKGVCSWYEFSRKILENTRVKINPVSSEEYPQKAYRPRYSVLNLEKSLNTGFNIISWEDALKKMMN